MENVNIVVAGVGGQGSIFTAKILGSLYLARGCDVKANEVHGMAQRGGSIVTMCKAGERIDTPLVQPGTADYLIGLELSEAVRALMYLKPDGKPFVSSRVVNIAGYGAYADPGIFTGLIDAVKIAEEAGNRRCENAVLLGALSRELDFSIDEWRQSIAANVKPELVDVNMKAFTLGRDV